MLAEGFQIEVAPDDKARHAATPVLAGHLDAIDQRILDPGLTCQRLGDFHGRDILALPAEGVAHPVDEIEIAVGVLLHEVAGAEPGIAVRRHVAQDLALRGLAVGIALEPVHGIAGIVDDLADHLADLAGLGFDAEPVRSAQRLLLLKVGPHDLHLEALLQPPRNSADRARRAVPVEHRDIALGRRVPFHDLGDREALLESDPDIGAQAVAAAEPDLMALVRRARRRVQEIAAQLADIEYERGLVSRRVLPEIPGREFLADDDRAAPDERRAGREHPAIGMVHRQGVVHPVVRPDIHHRGEALRHRHQPVMVDVRGLRHPRRAARIDEQRLVLDRQVRLLGGAERRARKGLDGMVDARFGGFGLTMRPDLRLGLQPPSRGLEGGNQLARHDHMQGFNDVDAMGEARAEQIGVEQGADTAGPRHPEPEDHVFGSIRHQQRDHVALADSVGPRPPGVAVRPRIELAIGQRFAGRDQRHPVAVPFGELRHDVGKNPGWIFHDGCQPPQCAQRTCQQHPVIAQPTEQAQSRHPAFVVSSLAQ